MTGALLDTSVVIATAQATGRVLYTLDEGQAKLARATAQPVEVP